MTPDTIKQNVLKLQNANATPADIETYVQSASQQLQSVKNPANPNAGSGLLTGAANAILQPVKSFGGEIVASSAPGQSIQKSIGQSNTASANADYNYLKQVNQHLQEANQSGDTVNAQRYANVLKNFQFTGGTNMQDVFPNINDTNEQVIGNAIGTGLLAFSGGGLEAGGEAASGAVQGTKTIAQAIKEGALVGGTYGAIGGGSSAMGQNASAGNVAENTVIGGGVGAGAGALLGGVAGALPKLAALAKNITGEDGLSGKLAQSLEEQSLRLTPVQKQNLGSKIDDIVQFNLDNGIKGNPAARMEKMDSIIASKENQFQDFLNNEASDRTISKQAIQQKISAIPQSPQYADSRDIFSVRNQVKDANSTLDALYPSPEVPNGQPPADVQIPVNRLNNFKRSTFDGAFNKAGNKVLDDVEFSIGGVAQRAIEDSTKDLTIPVTDTNGNTSNLSVHNFNKDYGNALESKKLLKIAATRGQISFLGKLTSKFVAGIVGGAIGGVPGEIIGNLTGDKIAEEVAGTGAKTAVAGILNKLK